MFGTSKKHPVPILEAQKKTRWKLKEAPCPGAHSQYSQVWKWLTPPPPPELIIKIEKW